MTQLPVVANRYKPVGVPTSHVETVALLSLKTNQPKLEVTMEVDSDSNYTPEERVTEVLY